MLQARMSGDDSRLYSPNRDLAHIFGHILEESAKRIDDQIWPDLERLRQELEVTEEDFAACIEAIAVFVQADRNELFSGSLHEQLTAAGWFKAPAEANILYLAMVGVVTMGIAHQGVREATYSFDGNPPYIPCASYPDLIQHSRKVLQRLSESPWKRWWRKRWRSLIGAVRFQISCLRDLD